MVCDRIFLRSAAALYHSMDDQKKMALKIFFNGLKTGFKEFGESINKTVNTLLLSITYIFGVGSVYLIAKLQKKKLLDLKVEKNKETYYNGLMLSKKSKKEYYRQF